MVCVEGEKDDGGCALIQASKDSHSGLFQAQLMELLHVLRCSQKVSTHLTCLCMSDHPGDSQWVKFYRNYLGLMFALIKTAGDSSAEFAEGCG